MPWKQGRAYTRGLVRKAQDPISTTQEGHMRKLVAAVLAAALGVVVLAGCGSSSSSSTTSTSSKTATTASPGADAAIAAEVPAAIKSKGTLTVASDATYAPNEFVASDGHTVVGMDADLMKALAAAMGLKVKI